VNWLVLKSYYEAFIARSIPVTFDKHLYAKQDITLLYIRKEGANLRKQLIPLSTVVIFMELDAKFLQMPLSRNAKVPLKILESGSLILICININRFIANEISYPKQFHIRPLFFRVNSKIPPIP